MFCTVKMTIFYMSVFRKSIKMRRGSETSSRQIAEAVRPRSFSWLLNFCSVFTSWQRPEVIRRKRIGSIHKTIKLQYYFSLTITIQFFILNLHFNWLRSLMDKTKVSGTFDGSSILPGATKC